MSHNPGTPLPSTPKLTGDPHKLKKCAGCKLMKGLLAFPKDAHRPDGLSPRCKPCRRAQNRKNNGVTHPRLYEDSSPMRRAIDAAKARDAEWIAEGAAMLRANTDAVRPTGRAE